MPYITDPEATIHVGTVYKFLLHAVAGRYTFTPGTGEFIRL